MLKFIQKNCKAIPASGGDDFPVGIFGADSITPERKDVNQAHIKWPGILKTTARPRGAQYFITAKVFFGFVPLNRSFESRRPFGHHAACRLKPVKQSAVGGIGPLIVTPYEVLGDHDASARQVITIERLAELLKRSFFGTVGVFHMREIPVGRGVKKGQYPKTDGGVTQ